MASGGGEVLIKGEDGSNPRAERDRSARSAALEGLDPGNPPSLPPRTDSRRGDGRRRDASAAAVTHAAGESADLAPGGFRPAATDMW
jgi:hypothetical protein